MTPREAIDQAKDRLINSRDLNAILNKYGRVNVLVLPPARYMYDADAVPSNEPSLFVTFTIEPGNNLIADFQGHKEFAA